jgi:hypothetical protein
MRDEMDLILRKVELLAVEFQERVTSKCHLRILHRFGKDGMMFCSAGEEVWAVMLVVRDKEIHLRLCVALRLLIDYLARTRHIPQSASQIIAGLRQSEFHLKHGHLGGVPQRRKISRSLIREYVRRIRKALGIAFLEAGLQIDAKHVLVSQPTTGTEVLYQLKALVEWVHIEKGAP